MITLLSTHLLRILLIVEVCLLSLSVFVNSVVNFIFTHREKQRDIIQTYLQDKMVALMTEKVKFSTELFPKKYLKLSAVVPVLESFNQKVSGQLWIEIKEYFIFELLNTSIKKSAQSKSIVDKSWVLRALKLVEKQPSEDLIFQFLKDPAPIIRFSAGACAIRSHNEKLLHATIDQMAKERPLSRYPYLDELILGDDFIYSTLKKRYLTEEDCEVRKCLLQVLSTKLGYLTLDLLKKDIESESYELRWWGIRALEKYPTHDTVEYLTQNLDDQNWKIEALVIRILGAIRALAAKNYIEQKLNSENIWVRFAAGLALKELGVEGRRLLENQTDPEKKKVAQFVLALHEHDLKTLIGPDPEHWLITFYP